MFHSAPAFPSPKAALYLMSFSVGGSLESDFSHWCSTSGWPLAARPTSQGWRNPGEVQGSLEGAEDFGSGFCGEGGEGASKVEGHVGLLPHGPMCKGQDRVSARHMHRHKIKRAKGAIYKLHVIGGCFFFQWRFVCPIWANCHFPVPLECSLSKHFFLYIIM